MSTLLEQASLIMIPSGYKEDVVYSVIPENGNGDLSFTRASNGTRINSAGLVEVTPWNLYTYSEQLNDASWTKLNASVTANATTAPNGTLTADLLVCVGGAAGTNYVRQAKTISDNTHTLSFYAKENASAIVKIAEAAITGQQLDYNLSTNTISGSGSQISGTITNDVNGWKKITFTYIYTTGQTTCIFNINSLSCFVWGVQLNTSSTAKPYFPTTDRLNVPRLTYQNGGGGCPSLLLEKQSTNLALYSEQFDNAAFIKTAVSITANTSVSPDGNTNADTIIEDSTTSQHRIIQLVSTTTGIVYTASVFCKSGSGTRNLAILFGCGFGEQEVIFNVNNGTIVSSTNATGTITNYGNGWYRCTATATSQATTSTCVQYQLRDGSLQSYLGNGTSSLIIWGAQLEVGSYPTSYIPTTSASATRIADACSKTGIGSLIGGTSGTVFFDIKTNPTLSSANYKQFCYYFDSANAQSYMYLNSANQITTNANWGSLFYNTALQPNTRYKVALVFAPNDFALYINGVSVATASSGTPNTNVDIQIGQFNGTEMCEFVFNQYTHFPSRLTNSELASLTTI